MDSNVFLNETNSVDAKENLKMKNIITACILGVAMLGSAALIMLGMGSSGKMGVQPAFSLYGYEGVLYRLNNVNGRIDVLVPSNEAALLFPVGQVQLPAADSQLTEEQQRSFSQNIKTLSQYIQIERSRSLGLKGEASQPLK